MTEQEVFVEGWIATGWSLKMILTQIYLQEILPREYKLNSCRKQHSTIASVMHTCQKHNVVMLVRDGREFCSECERKKMLDNI